MISKFVHIFSHTFTSLAWKECYSRGECLYRLIASCFIVIKDDGFYIAAACLKIGFFHENNNKYEKTQAIINAGSRMCVFFSNFTYTTFIIKYHSKEIHSENYFYFDTDIMFLTYCL